MRTGGGGETGGEGEDRWGGGATNTAGPHHAMLTATADPVNPSTHTQTHTHTHTHTRSACGLWASLPLSAPQHLSSAVRPGWDQQPARVPTLHTPAPLHKSTHTDIHT